MLRIVDIVVSSALLLAGIGLFAMTLGGRFDAPTFGGDVGPAFAPRLFLIAWVLLAAIATAHALRSGEQASDRPVNIKQMTIAVFITVVTAYAITKIGFVFAAVPGLFFFSLAFGYRNFPVLVLVSLVTVPAIWAIFTFGFELLLPRSPWFHFI